MATMRNILDNTRIILNLTGEDLGDGLGYDLSVLTRPEKLSAEFLHEMSSNSNRTPYMHYEEIKKFCTSLSSLIDNEINGFVFEPMHFAYEMYEKCFRLELEAIRSTMGDHFGVRLFMEQGRKYSTSGIQMYVTKEDLDKFKDEFEDEYFRVMRKIDIEKAEAEAKIAHQCLENHMQRLQENFETQAPLICSQATGQGENSLNFRQD